jgi:hypothetical protein
VKYLQFAAFGGMQLRQIQLTALAFARALLFQFL